MNEISITRKWEVAFYDTELLMVEFDLEKPVDPRIGVDPGRNFGAARVWGTEGFVMSGTIEPPGLMEFYAVCAFYLMEHFLKICAHWDIPWNSIIEGSAFSLAQGQTGLAYVRFGFYMGLHHFGDLTTALHMVPPNSIRFQVFGHGNKKGEEVYPELNSNAADAVAAALYAPEGVQYDTG